MSWMTVLQIVVVTLWIHILVTAQVGHYLKTKHNLSVQTGVVK